MALPLTITVSLPSSSYATSGVGTLEVGGATYGNDALGTGASASSTSSILIYGAIALFVLWIFKLI